MMDPFWAPMGAYAIVIIVGGLVAALGASISEDATTQEGKQAGGLLLALGGGVFMVGASAAAVKLIGTIVEKIF